MISASSFSCSTKERHFWLNYAFDHKRIIWVTSTHSTSICLGYFNSSIRVKNSKININLISFYIYYKNPFSICGNIILN